MTAYQTRELARLRAENASLKREAEDTRQWALQAFEEQRRLSDRCTFLYGAAIAHGATQDYLKGGLS